MSAPTRGQVLARIHEAGLTCPIDKLRWNSYMGTFVIDSMDWEEWIDAMTMD